MASRALVPRPGALRHQESALVSAFQRLTVDERVPRNCFVALRVSTTNEARSAMAP
jgi:hypothetical protein